MPYTTIYQITYKSFEENDNGEFIEINLCNKKYLTNDIVTPTIITLIPTDQPFIGEATDNNRDKFNVFRALAATLNIESAATIDQKIFSEGEDDAWFVEAHVQSTGYSLFQGFIVMDGNEIPFLPPETYTYTITATDNLGTLKDVALTKPDGTNPRGYFKAIEYISWILQKTGLKLNIIINDSWMEESQPTNTAWYDYIYLWSKTFEDQINTSINCYTALEQILGFNCNIQQVNGEWWITRIDERHNAKSYRFKYDYQGNLIGQLTPDYFRQYIGNAEQIKFIEKNAVITPVRPHKYAKLNYKFEYPLEIVDNIDFSRGDFYAPVLVPAPQGSVGAAYRLEDWTAISGTFVSQGAPIDIPRIERIFTDGVEKERYARLQSSSRTVAQSMFCNPIPTREKDKFSFSIDYRFATPRAVVLGASVIIQLILVGGSGKKYVLTQNARFVVLGAGSPTIWADFTGQRDGLGMPASNGTEWITVSTNGDVAPLPEDGNVYINLPFISNDVVDYQNLQFKYTPYINGSYAKYVSQYNKVSQSGNYTANVNQDTYLSDSPRPLFKGTMFKAATGGTFKIAGLWYAGGDLLNQGIKPPPSRDFMHPFGQLQIFAVWNQYRREFIQISGSAKGLRLHTNSVPSLADNYFINASNNQTDNKTFIPCNISQNTRADQWETILLETDDSVLGKDYSSPHEFKYEQ